MSDPSIVYRKITNKYINSEYVSMYPSDMVNYYGGNMKVFHVTDWDENILESYYGYGLQKLMESVGRRKGWLFGKRHFRKTNEG